MEQPPSPTSTAVPARAGLHARRAAAARRRALLTVTLLVLTAATGALAATTAVSVWFVLAPAVLLVAVLALGRKAVRANAHADAAWEAREHSRRAAASSDARLTGRPAPAVRPQVTGRAVKSSQSHTQMIARVRPSAGSSPSSAADADAAGTAGSGSPVGSAGTAGTAGSVAGETSGEARPDAGKGAGNGATGDVEAPAGTVAGARADSGAAASSASAARAASAGDAPDQSEDAAEWTSVPVPRPVYTMKSAAPRWEPAPLTAEMAQITQARRAELAAGDSAPVEAAAGGPAGVPAGVPAGDAPSATSEGEAPSDSLGVNLNSVLARRRAVGE